MILFYALWTLDATTSAHRPHTVVTAMADAVEPGHAWALLDPHDISQLMRTQDGGAHWDHQASPAMEKPLAGIAVDNNNVLYVLATDGTLWIKPETETWSHTDSPSTDTVYRDIKSTHDGVLIASSSGIRMADNTGYTRIIQPQFIDATRINVTCDEDCPVTVIGANGGVWTSDSIHEELLPLSALPGGRNAVSVQRVERLIFVGTQAGTVWQDLDEGTWELCGSIPSQVTGAHEGTVAALAISSDQRLLAATGHEAMFVSEDDCQLWTRIPTGAEVPFGGIGNATDPSDSWAYLALSEASGLVGGFSGAAFSLDAGENWQPSAMLRNRYTRAVALGQTPEGGLRVYSAGYGGGSTWTDDGGESWTGSAKGLDSETVTYDMALIPDEPEVVLMTGLSAVYRSQNSGSSWSAIDVPMERSRALDLLGNTLYLLGETPTQQGVEPQIARSTDSGLTWTPIEGYTAAAEGAMGSRVRGGVLRGESLIAVATDVPAGVLVSADNGDSWTRWLEGVSEPSAGLEFWPPMESGRLVFASPSTGILLGTGLEDDWWSPRSPPAGEPRRLTIADDGTLLVGTRGGAVWESLDGGETWEILGQGPPCAIHEIVTAPNFSQNRLVLLGTQLGIWWSDGGDFQPAPWLERLENGGVFLRCNEPDGYCPTYSNPSEGAGGGIELVPGGAIRFATEASHLRLLASGGGEWELFVDGNPVSTSAGEAELSETGWKDIEVRLQAGELRVDGIEAWGPGTPFPWEETRGDTSDDTSAQPTQPNPKEEGCGGCATAPTTPKRWPLLWLAPMAWAKNRRNQAKRR